MRAMIGLLISLSSIDRSEYNHKCGNRVERKYSCIVWRINSREYSKFQQKFNLHCKSNPAIEQWVI